MQLHDDMETATDPVAYELASLRGGRADAIDEAAAGFVRGVYIAAMEQAAEAGEVRWLLDELSALRAEAERRQVLASARFPRLRACGSVGP